MHCAQAHAHAHTHARTRTHSLRSHTHTYVHTHTLSLSLSLSLSLTHTHTFTHTHARVRTHSHTLTALVFSFSRVSLAFPFFLCHLASFCLSVLCFLQLRNVWFIKSGLLILGTLWAHKKQQRPIEQGKKRSWPCSLYQKTWVV
jgi:hypothetical protein